MQEPAEPARPPPAACGCADSMRAPPKLRSPRRARTKQAPRNAPGATFPRSARAERLRQQWPFPGKVDRATRPESIALAKSLGRAKISLPTGRLSNRFRKVATGAFLVDSAVRPNHAAR